MFKLYIEKNISSKDLLKKVFNEYEIKADIIYNEYGKPYLKDNQLYFNISHCDDYTVLAISNSEVGVDIEKITMKKRIIDRICTDEEKRIIKTPEDFTIIWVKKESYVKYLSIGLTYGLKNVDTLKPYNFIIKKIDNYYISVYLGEMIDVSEV